LPKGGVVKLAGVAFLGVRGVADAAYDLVDPGTGRAADVVVVRGAGASGKTRLLEAIVAAKEAIAPYGGDPWPDPLLRDGVAAKVRLVVDLDEEERFFAGLTDARVEAEVALRPGRAEAIAPAGLRAVLGRYTHGAGAGKVEYVPASRVVPAQVGRGALDPASQRALRATRRPDKYAFVPRLLAELAPDDADADAFAQALAALSPTCRFEPRGARCLRSRGGPLATVHEVSDGERDAVLFAATAVAIDLRSSIMLVDRPDLHVAPGGAARFVAGLRALGDDNQLVLAVTSPAMLAALAGAPAIALPEAP
jgi:hypothetical protein